MVTKVIVDEIERPQECLYRFQVFNHNGNCLGHCCKLLSDFDDSMTFCNPVLFEFPENCPLMNKDEAEPETPKAGNCIHREVFRSESTGRPLVMCNNEQICFGYCIGESECEYKQVK